MPLTRAGQYELNDVLPFVIMKGKHRDRKNPAAMKIYDGKRVWMTSSRYRCFAKKGIKCVTCGIEGKYFALENSVGQTGVPLTETWHFNLYALNSDGQEIMMTQDHIIPYSKGGRGCLDNLQPMCSVCNLKKGNTL